MKPAFLPHLAVWLVSGACVVLNAASPPRPNILVIQSDDHGYADLSCTEHDTGAATPNLDRLAAGGVRFTNGYATSPICTPSRIGLLLGAYQQRYDNWWYGGPGLPAPAEAPTVAEVLKSAGYRTAMIGKYHVNRPFDPSTRNFPLNHGFDFFYGFNSPAVHYLRRGAEMESAFLDKLREHAPRQLGYPIMFYQPWWKNGTPIEPEGFSTDLFADAAIGFMNEAAEEPFFVLLSFNAIHDTTSHLPPDYLRSKGIEPPPDWDPSVESLDQWRARVFAGDLDRIYLLGQIEFLDRAVGRILDSLDESGQRRDTVVFYVSDNGGSLFNASRNDPLRGGKFTMCEGGIRVPFIASWPGVFLENEVLDNVVSTMDILPTAAGLAGAPVPESSDGIDLSPLLTGADRSLGHETLVWDGGERAHMWAVRHGEWKLYYSSPSGRVSHAVDGVGFRLTHLGRDPGETHNLILEYPGKAAELGALHRDWTDEIYPEQDFEER